MMRGGNTAATVAIGNSPIEIPPVAPAAWAGFVMHHAFIAPVAAKLGSTSVALVNSSIVPAGALDHTGATVIEVPAADIAQEVGNILAASMVLLGAMASSTGIVGLDALLDAVAVVVPPYRRQHIEVNQVALRAGYTRFPALVAPAWTTAKVSP
jgi:2-oxoglutarate ferredoxin oxidoreductase subunit gamma